MAARTSSSPVSDDSRPGGLGTRAPELRELRYFQAVARTGNFGRAARELNLSQPAVTQQVHKLEEGLGTKLFVRHGRGVILTPMGAQLLERLEVVMRMLDAPLREETARPSDAAGIVRVALPAEVAALTVARLVAHCRARSPALTLTFREADSASLEEWLISGRVDVAVLQDPPVLDTLCIEPALTERLGLVMNPRARLAQASTVQGRGSAPDDPVRARELMGLPMILPHARHWIRRKVDHACTGRGIAFGPIQEVDSVTVIKAMLRHDLGCSLLPHSAVRDEVAHGTIVFRPIDQLPLTTTHAVTSRLTSGMAGAAVAQMLRDIMGELVESGLWSGARVIEPAPEPPAVPATALEPAGL